MSQLIPVAAAVNNRIERDPRWLSVVVVELGSKSDRLIYSYRVERAPWSVNRDSPELRWLDRTWRIGKLSTKDCLDFQRKLVWRHQAGGGRHFGPTLAQLPHFSDDFLI